MAQSIAALAGIRARGADKPIPLGMLIGCRSYESRVAHFPTGSELNVTIEELAAEEFGFGSFDCQITNPEAIARARVSVFGGDRHDIA